MNLFVFIVFTSTICLFPATALIINGGINFIIFGSYFNDYVKTTLNYNFTSLKDTKYFNTSKPTAVFVHGWITDFTKPENKALAIAFINRGDFNTVIIDWSKYAYYPVYPDVASSINDQAAFINQVLIQMQNAGYNLTSFYFIGHSLGAQIVGRVGYQLIKNYNFTPTRITGLDPAGPDFGDFNDWPTGISLIFPSLNSQNAKFVDIIHTEINGQGIYWSAGHLDFWPNYGHDQPGCSIDPFYFTCNPENDNCLNCNHFRAVKYFTDSVQSGSVRKFKSLLCNGTNYLNGECYGVAASMGFYADQYANNPGNYFLTTTVFPPTVLVINGGINFIIFGSNFSDYVNTTLNYNFTSLKDTKYFNTSKPTAVFVHGWNTDFTVAVNQALSVAFINRGDFNVIAIDWSKYSHDLNYPDVASSINDQAAFINQVLIQMQNAAYNLTSFHFIGHSLGAQIVGRVGYQLIKNYNFTPTRISRLDPAGPEFGKFNDWPTGVALVYPSLNSQNAKFVDIIHTDTHGEGIHWSAGHLDFWPNYGHDQPGCSIDPLYSTCNPANDDCIYCSHVRALKYYTESVQSGSVRKFKSLLCNETNYLNGACYGVAASMGFYSDQYANNPGNYFLTTTGVSPYSVSNV